MINKEQRHISHIIHYCWFGENPLPENAVKCIESWRKYFPDYEIKEWNEKNFDLSCCEYIKEAYQCKKWAFVSDYARFKILYEEGGLYFDTDVEVIKSLDDIIAKGPFMGKEAGEVNDQTLEDEIVTNPGLGLAAAPGLVLYKEVVDYYNGIHFDVNNIITVCEHVTNILKEHGYKGDNSIEDVLGIKIYPPEYFCPMNQWTGKITITNNTRSIHHYSATWQDPYSRFKAKVQKILGPKLTQTVIRLKRKLRG